MVDTNNPPTDHCLACGKQGKSVDTGTVKALLKLSLRVVHQNTQYYFCSTEICDVVYFTVGQAFAAADIREPVYQKHPYSSSTPICYCFNHTVGDIYAHSLPKEKHPIVQDIRAGIPDQCACDIRNPQGSCCLGNVYQLLKISPNSIQTSDVAT